MGGACGDGWSMWGWGEHAGVGGACGVGGGRGGQKGLRWPNFKDLGGGGTQHASIY